MRPCFQRHILQKCYCLRVYDSKHQGHFKYLFTIDTDCAFTFAKAG